MGNPGDQQPFGYALDSLGEALDHLQESFVICDAEDRIVFANRRFRSLNVAVKEATIPGTPYPDFLAALAAHNLVPKARGHEQAWLEGAVALRRSKENWTLEFERSGGTWLLVSFVRLPDGGSITFDVDITARKRTEEALRESEARFRNLTALSSDWYWEQDADLRFVSTSGRHTARGGISAEEHYGKRRWELPRCEILGQTWDEHRELLARRKPFRDVMLRRTGEDGKVHYVRTSGEPMFDAGGAFKGYSGIAQDVTERVLAQERERAADERLRQAIEHLNESIAVTDAEDRIVIANRRFRELNGATGLIERGRKYEEHLRAGIALGNYPEAAADGERWIADRLARRRAGGSFEVKRQDGVWLRVTDQRLPDGGMISFALDITARKEAELAVAESEQRFRDVASASAEWFWETDAQGHYTWVSESMQAATGIRAADLIGLDRIAYLSRGADLSAEPWASHLRALERHEPFRDFRVQMYWMGAPRWVSASGVPRFGADGAFQGYRGTGSDVTERAAAESRARLAEERLRAALENLGEMIALTDADDRIVFANRRFALFNAPVADFIVPGRRYDEHLRAGIARGLFPEAAGREEQWIAERLAARRNPTGPVERRRQDGRWLLVDDQRLPDGSIITFGIEITERKNAEEALRNINAELERRVAERTLQLERAYRELEAFSYSVSHDLRAPLGVIASFAGLLNRQEAGRISEDGVRLLSVIDANAQRMAKLIDALLELMRLSRRQIERKPLDMAALARQASEELRAGHPQAAIEVGALPAAQGDATLVKQVYANLVGNALKFSARAASPRVEIGATAQDGATVYFVRDNGAGFDMQHADKLFQPFERLHAESEYPGTGIGLALASLIVQRHGGRIWAASAPGEGATFSFTLGGGVAG